MKDDGILTTNEISRNILGLEITKLTKPLVFQKSSDSQRKGT